MVGSNSLKLNNATMLEALQLWCDNNFIEPVDVESVSEDKSTGMFDVGLKESEKAKSLRLHQMVNRKAQEEKPTGVCTPVREPT